MRMMAPPLTTTTTANLCSPIVSSSSSSRFNLKPRPHLRLRATGGGGVGALVTPHHSTTPSGGATTATATVTVTATRISFSPVMMEASSFELPYRTRRKESVEDCSSISGDEESSPFCSPLPSTPPPLSQPQAQQAVPRANYIYDKTPSLLLPDPHYLNRALSLVDREEREEEESVDASAVSDKMSFGFPDLCDDENEKEKKKFKKGRRILKVNYNNIKQQKNKRITTTSSSLASSSNKSTLTHHAAVTPNNATTPANII
eukprot:CAMPEP_0178957238 /NCGR_PEP_ID=MMETSP0789-20121207/10776_1 /TAXON_ID=3005 /ORGANISM="Rhizosolenia setigera, Strain CCMP 1694" /LENGTH=259 /DNA_ID=CAMNT_0020639411 /DNA_START=104 /DNA_END=883 /DNA_ORIENTATION=-